MRDPQSFLYIVIICSLSRDISASVQTLLQRGYGYSLLEWCSGKTALKSSLSRTSVADVAMIDRSSHSVLCEFPLLPWRKRSIEHIGKVRVLIMKKAASCCRVG
jgi:hypothetical protein